jgi:4,5:9,10-diseco-3-hydroxy-5,9,17-trioxoandrosta-1(10),2-diene-4-oate hydrolase
MSALPEGQFVTLPSGHRMHYHTAGEGHPVVFVHGSGPGASGWSNFKGNYPFFAKHGYRTLVPDSLGYGFSDKPDEKYTLDFLVDGLVGFCDALGLEQVSLVGNSLGGAMCIRMATRHPERVHKLVLMAPGGLEDRETYMGMKGIRTMMGPIYGPEGVTREGLWRTFRLQLFDPSDITEQTIDERWQIAEDQPLHVFKRLRVDDLRPELAQVKAPTLVLWGRDDQFCPVSGASTLAAALEDVRVVQLARCGHWVMVEYTQLFNRWSIDFLKGVGA